jgi:hypothetical protein
MNVTQLRITPTPYFQGHKFLFALFKSWRKLAQCCEIAHGSINRLNWDNACSLSVQNILFSCLLSVIFHMKRRAYTKDVCVLCVSVYVCIYVYMWVSKTILVTGCGGPQGCEISRLAYFPDNRLTDCGEVVCLTRRPPFNIYIYVCVCVWGAFHRKWKKWTERRRKIVLDFMNPCSVICLFPIIRTPTRWMFPSHTAIGWM